MFQLFEDRARHRMALELQREHRDARRADLGLAAGFTAVLAVLASAVYCASIGQAVVAGVLGGLDIVALAGVFILGAQMRRSERLQQVQLLRQVQRAALGGTDDITMGSD